VTTIDDQGRPEPPVASGEVETLLGFLDFQRATLGWRTSDLDRDGLTATVGVSTMTLGGLLKHMAWVEDYWFSCRLHGNEPDAAWVDVDWTSDPDWEWNSAADDEPDALRTLWADAADRSRALTATALGGGGLDRLASTPWPSGDAPSLRWIVVHMIEEYARHNGHADLLRESVDGQTGE
jgi:uncharacterized damage-inducible protein DinB